MRQPLVGYDAGTDLQAFALPYEQSGSAPDGVGGVHDSLLDVFCDDVRT